MTFIFWDEVGLEDYMSDMIKVIYQFNVYYNEYIFKRIMNDYFFLVGEGEWRSHLIPLFQESLYT